MSQYVLVIDQSTQATKLLLLTRQGQIKYRASLGHRQIIDENGWISHSLTEIKSNINLLVKKMLQKISAKTITAVAITNQRETAAAWSKSTGEQLENAVVWQCSRAKEIVEQLAVKRGFKEEVKKKTGLPLSAYFTAAKFSWLLKKSANVKTHLVNDDLCIGTIDSWLLYQLTAGRSFKTESSNASRTQLLNLRTQQWDPELCRKFEVPLGALPEIVDSDSLFGMTDFGGLLPQPIPIRSMLGDSQAALLAHDCQKTGALKATFGTGSSVMLSLGETLHFSAASPLNASVGWRRKGKTTYVLEGNINYTGAIVSWMQHDLRLITDPKETASAAYAANKNDRTILLPAFSGMGTLYANLKCKAAFFNMKRITGRSELIRAALNTVAYQINDVILQFQKEGIELQNVLHVDGGMIDNYYLMQFLSNLTQKEVVLAPLKELSAWGTALNSGFFTADTFRRQTMSHSYIPQISGVESQQLVRGWNEVIQLASDY
ncbi:glycerol kinase [Liquorilactobacillus sucicola DSM 21376 = JCM 15457]|uniref:Glycerol kinase n=1 Tax=Liquorilactobacillus sucicola DSM 21376 = JCM 15457 TaxID=1423806 RepID=A0A023CYZ8_9LACO|nr:FGGY family carbohydrate kinase [Liquorilactobacillus sucicola]KRN06625.1 glycerol kinase [Liquorilactobacillus sucicola DSM 21376 = JCM 15457]GAJ27117.1 glycerol kinase [Liquorilactobacillus sucicola DSM 21376 = JCM 15457]